MEKKEDTMSPLKACMIICVGVLCSATILLTTYWYLFGFGDAETAAEVENGNNMIDPEHVVDEIVVSEEEIDQQVKEIILSIVGEETDYGVATIIDLQVNDHLGTEDPDDKLIIARIFGNDNLTPSLTRKGWLAKSADLFEELFSLENIEEVSLMWNYPFTDTAENEEPTMVLNISIERESISEINWGSFDYNRLDQVATQYWVHPAIQD
ncbi:hypothetical protein [Halalkalibacter oceani]|uniref:hypothetical protein n=1 Tax=Halalkalibacter oceani TaxID=1653776 RepID=UPI003395FBD9